jgi:hypothetical protein
VVYCRRALVGACDGGLAFGDNVVARIFALPCSSFAKTVTASSPTGTKDCSRRARRGRRACVQAPITVAALNQIRSQNEKGRMDGTELRNLEPRQPRQNKGAHTRRARSWFLARFSVTRGGLVRSWRLRRELRETEQVLAKPGSSPRTTAHSFYYRKWGCSRLKLDYGPTKASKTVRRLPYPS